MTESKICTCPSGDGSLRWPCPAHPAVEQAGGDERAADEKPRATRCPDCGEHDLMPGDLCACGYETDPATGYACSECDGSGEGCFGEVCRECDGSGWFVTPDQARVALAQPYPALHPAPELDFSRPLETENGDPVKWICDDVIEYKSALVCVAKDTGLVYSSPYIGLKIRNVMPEQAEAERPEVFGLERYRVERTGQGFWPYCVRAGDGTRELFVGHLKQCKRVAAQLATAFEDGKFVAGALRAENAKLIEALDESDGDRWKLRSERDAANARLHEVATACATAEQERDAALARVAELERQEPVVRAYGVLPPFAEKVLTKLRRFYDCAEDFESGGVDIGRHWLDLLTQLGLLNRVQRSPALWEISQHGEDLLEAPVAQAGQVPDGWKLVPIEPTLEMLDARRDCEDGIDGYLVEDTEYYFPDRGAVRDFLARVYRGMLAAAPGKEVPQAWLDVQAERRRQVEVEGYHGFRDNHYISYELSKAARAYIEVSWHALSGGLPCKKPESWPWMAGFKWSDGRTMLVKAGALILAEIERLDRAAPGKEVGHE
ncbi:TPA: hypothetical protein NIJ32_002215 [Pseudomonas aeruginosa]|nr:hypothetical protein [Pseudomonas aeruginosa]